ncbi:MAG: MotA/TolQ/ExbB proton channel family protein [Candidatus Hydrogenedentes bacterium]|nr:MotA/TolQ/ExbB proton channel family protein [Candidatus Hydrogenedentota bacterium]
MDPITIVGILLGVFSVLFAAVEEGTSLSALLAPTALLIVFGGTTGATISCFTIRNILDVLGNVKLIVFRTAYDFNALIEMFVEMAGVTRKDGILALENYKLKVDHPFLKRGIRLIVDGTNAELVKQLMITQMTVDEEALKTSAAVFATAGGFAPTLGIIGTVVGLVNVLGNLSDPESLGPAIAMAFIATLYGVSSANLMFLPISKKFGIIAKEEVAMREMITEGVLSIYAGDGPHVVSQKLLAFLTEKERAHAKTA